MLAVILIPIWLIFGRDEIELESEEMTTAMKCKHECEGGRVGFTSNFGDGVDYPHCWYLPYFECYFEVALDTAADGSSLFKQQYISCNMIR